MNKNLRYLQYVLKHKYYVFRAGRTLGVSWWQLLIHDWQKFTPSEWSPYVDSFYGEWKYKNRPTWLVDAFDRAWLHHQHYGPHHWQYWILQEDSGKRGALEIPEHFVKEMVADWVGAGIAITGQNNVCKWYDENKCKIILHPATHLRVEQLLEKYFDYIPEWRR